MQASKVLKFSLVLIFQYFLPVLANKTYTGDISTDPDDVLFYLYPNANDWTDFDELKYLDLNSIDRSRFNPQNPVKFLIHGFTQNSNTLFPVAVVNAYLISGYAATYNIIVVDWGKLSSTYAKTLSGIPIILEALAEMPVYIQVVDNVPIVGRRIYEFILFLMLNNKIHGGSSNIHLIGHSLGAHVAGVVGGEYYKFTSSLIGRITGSDPAGPLYQGKSLEVRLDPSDAQFVDIIHTNQGGFGYAGNMGHVDFYVNEANPHNSTKTMQVQPGCIKSNRLRFDPSHLICSHNAATKYFARSIWNHKLVGTPICTHSSLGICLLDYYRKPVAFGEACPTSARGEYSIELILGT